MTSTEVEMVGEIRHRIKKDFAHILAEDGKTYFAHISRVRGSDGRPLPLLLRDEILEVGTPVVFRYFPGDFVAPHGTPKAFDIRRR